jgi:hypothetical protein
MAPPATNKTVKPTCVPASRDQGWKGKLKPNHEHEKDDAELGQKSNFVPRSEKAQSMWPDD